MSRIAELSEHQFAEHYERFLKTIEQDPIENFVKAPGLINFTPTPAQTVALKVFFNKPLDPLTPHALLEEFNDDVTPFGLRQVIMTEYEIYRFMTGREYVPGAQLINRLNFIIGRRGGKTTLSSILAIYSAICTNWKPYLRKHPYATVLVLSNNKELSEEILDLIRTFIEDSPVLSRLVDKTKKGKDRQNVFHLRVPFLENGKVVYSKVAIRLGAASKKTTRGKAICALLCDEIAFWNLDEDAADSDEDILRAARPSLLQFGDRGLLIKLSSPGIKQGVLYNEWDKWVTNEPGKKLPDSYVCFKAPSWIWNNILQEKDFRDEFELDPVGFACEYRADFVDSISNFISPEFVELCKVKGATFREPDPKTDFIAASIDAAFKGDRFAFTVIGAVGGRLVQFAMKTWMGSRINPVKARLVAEYIRVIVKEYGVGEVTADQFAFQPLSEIFEQYGVKLVERTFTNTFKKQVYFNLKKLVHNQQIDLLDHEDNIKEIKQLQVEQSATGTVRIGHPPGGHDDCADVTAVASFIVTEGLGAAGMDLMEVAGSRHEIPVDPHSGKAFVAPTSEMVAEVQDLGFEDNLSEYYQDPETGEWRRLDDDEDDDDGPTFII
jgi:hypothetical protein